LFSCLESSPPGGLKEGEGDPEAAVEPDLLVQT